MGQQINIKTVQVGDITPHWAADYSHTIKINIEEFLGHSAVLLLFYPADWTPIVRDELPLWEELIGMSGNLKLKVFGISNDTIECHQAFAHEVGLDYIFLLSDQLNQIAEVYGLPDPSDGLGRLALVLIDEQGVIQRIEVEPEGGLARSPEAIEDVLQQVRQWYGMPTDPEVWKQERLRAMQLPHPAPLKPPTKLQLRFWGTRGSAPVSGVGYSRYGGNTSCVSLTSDSGHLFIFDCGSGARELGNYLLTADWPPPAAPGSTNGHRTVSGYILLSHTHLDHIQGFPFFAPIFKPGNRFHIMGWANPSQTLGSTLAGLMEHIYFPVSMDSLPSTLYFYSLRHEQQAMLDGTIINTVQLNHPIPSTAYRLDLGGKTIVYATDHEPRISPNSRPDAMLDDEVIDWKLVHLAYRADILIHDAQYSATELLDKVGWGHSSIEVAVDIAIRAEVKRLVLYHHDPGHDDAALDKLLAAARERAGRLGHPELEILSASDGLQIEL